MLRVTPLYGSLSTTTAAIAAPPECNLIEYGGCRVLWNVGEWRGGGGDGGAFPTLPDHDVVIITDSSAESMGGLPLYYRQIKARYGGDIALPPIYATFPTVKMGQMMLYDAHASRCLDGQTPLYSLPDIDDVIDAMTSIKFAQAMAVMATQGTNTKASLTITAHRAGHVVGGSFLVLRRLQDETVVVLTSKLYIAREACLDAAQWNMLRTPDVLVTHAGGVAWRGLHGGIVTPPQLVTQAQRNVVEAVLAVLRRDGHVLLPTDAAGRVLELLLILHSHWQRHRLQAAYNLVWYAPLATNVQEFAKTQLEWMNASLGKQFDAGDGHPLSLPLLQTCTSWAQVQAILANNNPTCVVAAGLSLDAGPSRDVLLRFANNDDHAIIFTDSSGVYLRQNVSSSSSAAGSTTIAPSATSSAAAAAAAAAVLADEPDEEADHEAAGLGAATTVGAAVMQPSAWTVAGQLLRAWRDAKINQREMEDTVVIDVPVPTRRPLSGLALQQFLADEEAARVAEKARQERLDMLRQVELAKGQLHLGEDQDETNKVAANSMSTTTTPAATTTSQRKKKTRFDSSLFIKFSKPNHLKFETREEAVGVGQPDFAAPLAVALGSASRDNIVEDDYGIAVRPEMFRDIVSGVDPAKFGGGGGGAVNARIGDDVLRRGFGYANQDGRGKEHTATARVSDDEEEDNAELDETALEAMDLSEGHGIIRGRQGRPPVHVSVVYRQLAVVAEISYVPLEGRVDARAARQSVRAMQPRHVMVLGGAVCQDGDSEVVDEVAELAKAASSFATAGGTVLTPTDGVTTELNVGHAAYPVRLINKPFQPAKEAEVVAEPVETLEVKVGACNVSRIDFVATGQKVAGDGSLVLAPRLLPPGSSNDSMPPLYLSDGEVLLTDLRAELIGQGMKAEYSTRDGTAQLVVNGRVLVKKEQLSGRVSVEGPLCEDFYSVRSVVSGQYVIL